jgi:hypothetical protein
MSGATSIQKRSALPLIAGALVAAIAVGATMYEMLVVREEAATEAARAEADQLQEQVDRARAYLASRPDDKLSAGEVHVAALELARRVPIGRKDIAVAQYCQLRAADAGITDFKYEVVGGMALPDEKPGTEKPAEERLGLEPAKLQGQLISMEFSTEYKTFLKFVKTLSEAPWLLEVVSVDLRKDKHEEVEARVMLRYLYQ